MSRGTPAWRDPVADRAINNRHRRRKGMTLEEAADNIGSTVVYTAHHGAQETGVITAVGEMLVFVRYRPREHSQGTYPQDLELRKPQSREFPSYGESEWR